MAKLSILAGVTSQTVNVFIQNSSSTTGAGLTGLAYNTSGLTGYYVFPRAASAVITLATLAAVTSAFSSGGFKEIDSTNCPGLYRLDLPNAAIAAASGRCVTCYLQGAANMAPCVLEIELTAVDNQDGVRLGLTALPNAAAGAVGGLPLAVDTSGRVDVLKVNGTSQTARDIGASVIAASVTAGVTVTTYTGNTPQTGDSYARLGAPAGVSHAADVAAVKADSGGLRTDYTTARAGYLDTLNGIVAAIWAYATRTLSAFVFTVGVSGDLSATMKTSVESAVWDAATASHQTAGTAGKALTNAGSAGDPWATAVPGAYGVGTAGKVLGNLSAAADPWATSIPGAYGAGTAGNIIGANLNATVSSRAQASDIPSANIAAIKAKTDNLPASPAAVGSAMLVSDKTGFAPTAPQNADALLGRNLAGGSDGGRTVKDALRPGRNKVVVGAGSVTV